MTGAPTHLIAFALAAVAFRAEAADWPQWRGENRDGVTTEPFPDALPADGLKLLWRAEVGDAFSSVAVAAGRAYTMGRDGADEVVYCLDAASGRALWKRSYPAPWKAPGIAVNNSPRATPTVAKGRAFTFGATGVLSCFDAQNGKLLWRRDARRDFGARVPQYGAACSPLVDGDSVICMLGAPGASLAAFDLETGGLVWKALDDRAGYSSPVAATLDGVRQVMVMTEQGMVSVSASTGGLLWRHAMRTRYEQNIMTPVISGDLVLVSGVDRGCFAKRVRRTGGGASAETLWHTRFVSAYMSSPVFSGDVFFVHHTGGQLKCVSAEDGRVLWSRAGFGRNASIIRSGDRLLVLAASGELVLVQAAAAGYSELGRTRLVGRTWVHHAAAGGRLYARDEEGVRCFEMPE